MYGCDNQTGISAYLARGLAGFHELIKARARLYHDLNGIDQPHQWLNRWIVLGRFYLQEGAGFGIIRDDSRNPMNFSEYGNVLSEEYFKDLIRRKKGEDYYYTISLGEGLPPSADIKCPECGNGWCLEDAHDYHMISDEEVIEPDDDFFGKTLGEFERYIAHQHNYAQYRLSYECPVRNDKHVDNSPHPNIKGCKVNSTGYVNRDVGYIIEPGDGVLFSKRTYKHVRCHRNWQSKEYRNSFEEIFTKAGFDNFNVREIPNGYCSCIMCGPWYEFAIPGLGMIKIGWRKRVINIDWFGTGKNFESMFENEEVTKWENGIHAWGKDKAIEYLSKIRKETT